MSRQVLPKHSRNTTSIFLQMLVFLLLQDIQLPCPSNSTARALRECQYFHSIGSQCSLVCTNGTLVRVHSKFFKNKKMFPVSLTTSGVPMWGSFTSYKHFSMQMMLFPCKAGCNIAAACVSRAILCSASLLLPSVDWCDRGFEIHYAFQWKWGFFFSQALPFPRIQV